LKGVLSADEALLSRVQQANQQQIVGKLLHDLRNPIHSVRITIELFARLVRKPEDMQAMLERARRYIDPAEAAVNALVRNCERLSEYLQPAGAPKPVAVGLREWMEQLVTLLHGACSDLRVEWSPEAVDEQVRLVADRARLSHSVLRFCLSNAQRRVVLGAHAAPDEVCLDVLLDADGAAVRREAPMQFTAEDLRVLIETAGGRLNETAPGAVSLRFSRSP
jgi:light-regulated signal transduction histidine kinase (bacteriophytochrome)